MSLGIERYFGGPYIPEKYNQFFNPNICHICKRPDQILMSCDQCYMISYCGEEHKAIHHNSHMQICEAIRKIRTDQPDWNKACHLPKDWVGSQLEFILKMICVLRRSLEQYETEMFMCAKSCHVCHRQTDIIACKTCYSANFCHDHEVLFHVGHKNHCKELQLLLDFNIWNIQVDNLHTSLLDPVKFVMFPRTPFCSNMIEFIDEYVQSIFYHSRSYRGMQSWFKECYAFSDYTSCPLTLHYALQQSNLSYLTRTWKFVIHDIASSEMGVISLRTWELFLHIFCNIKELHIITIKSKISFTSKSYNLCSKCIHRKQKLYVENVPESYHDYVHSSSYKQPNIITAFDVEVSEEGIWLERLTTIMTRNCPLLLTAKSKYIIQEIFNMMQEKVGATRCVFKENPFRSYKPCREYVSGGIFYRNVHFIMFL